MTGRQLRQVLSLPPSPDGFARGPARLTIVRHHRVFAEGQSPTYAIGVRAATLEAQVRECVRLGATPITVSEGLDWLRTAVRGHRIAFSFDDGYLDNVEVALPILTAHGARATFYLTGGLAEQRVAPWWDRLEYVLDHAVQRRGACAIAGRTIAFDLSDDAGRQRLLRTMLPLLRVPPQEQQARLETLRHATAVEGDAPCLLADWTQAARFLTASMEVGAHTMTHPYLSLLEPDEQAREIGDSIALIEARLGVRVRGLAYPGGDHDARTVAVARAAGLEHAVVTTSGTVTAGDDPFTLRRRGLSEGACAGWRGGFSGSLMRAELEGRFDRLRRVPPKGPARDPRIRLLYVVGNFATGGAERHLLEMWRRLDRDRFDVQIACLRHDGGFTAQAEALGLPIHDLGVRYLTDPSGPRGLLRLIALVRRFRPDVIHGYLFSPNLLAALAGRWCGVPVVAIAKRNMDAFETPRQVGLQRLAHRLATHVTAVSREVATSSVALGAPMDRITVIENGVDLARFPAPQDRAFATPPVIGSVGCLAPRKDIGTLLAALHRLKSEGVVFRAVLVGEGPEHAALVSSTHALGLDAEVAFLGERADIEALLPTFDVFTLSSREEGIPNALLEAMAAGRPCVVTDVGGNREVLRDGETGWIVPAQNPEALARALAAVLRDPAEADRRGRAAREAMARERSIEAMVRRHEDFYRRALGRGGM